MDYRVLWETVAEYDCFEKEGKKGHDVLHGGWLKLSIQEYLFQNGFDLFIELCKII